MGLRLPLDALTWVAPEKREPEPAHNQFGELPELKDYHGEVAKRYSRLDIQPDAHPEEQQQPLSDDEQLTEVPHTALCFEAREGRRHLFLPPVGMLEHYLELVAAIETTAAELEMPVVLEG